MSSLHIHRESTNYLIHDVTNVKIIKNEVGCRDDTVPKKNKKALRGGLRIFHYPLPISRFINDHFYKHYNYRQVQ